MQPSSHGYLGFLTARQLGSARNVLSGENRNFRSLRFKVTKHHFCHLLLVKMIHRASPKSVWEGTIQWYEHWEVWFIWRLTATESFPSPDPSILCPFAAITGQIWENGVGGGGGGYMYIYMGVRLRGLIGYAAEFYNIE